MSEKKQMDIVICGVGGQGVILASKVLAKAALLSGFDVKASEVHGMAQRGGSVLSQVRMGEKVYSPTISASHAAMCLSFEEMEVLRYVTLVKKGAVVIVNSHKINPMPVELGQSEYPGDVEGVLKNSGYQVTCVDGLEELKKNTFPPKALNVFLLGVASKNIPIAEEHFIKAIEESVPEKTIDVNMQVFQLGRKIS